MINYFNTQNSLANFKFEFDPDRFVPTPTDLNQALKANIGLFKTDPDSWLKFNQMLGSNIGFNENDKFNKLIDKITEISNFNQIVNPQ